MVKLRLRRKGRTHLPVYDIIAVDQRKKRDGAYLERLGYFDPHTQPSTININPDRAIYWLNVGAQATPVVRKLLSYEGILLKKTMQFKGKSESEIEEAVELHKKNAEDRYWKMKEHRKQRVENKKKAEEEAKKAAEKAEEKTEEAPAAEE